MSAYENLLVASPDRRNAVAASEALLEEVGLVSAADTTAAGLSYGEQKMVAVARLLATGCRVLLFDEPGAGLARQSVDVVGQIFRRLADEQGRTVVLVEHNMHLVFNYADYIYVLHHGRLVASGTPAEIQRHPEVIRVYLTGAATEGES